MGIPESYKSPEIETVFIDIFDVLCTSPLGFESTMPDVDREEFEW